MRSDLGVLQTTGRTGRGRLVRGLVSLPVPEPTLDAGYTTAGSSPKANPSISLLQFFLGSIYEGQAASRALGFRSVYFG